MGVDLRLLPFDHDAPGLTYSHTVLDCERCGALYDAIGDIATQHGENVPDGFSSYMSYDPACECSVYGPTPKDAYDSPLITLRAYQLLALRSHEGVIGDWRNLAVWAYLGALPPETRVALFWH